MTRRTYSRAHDRAADVRLTEDESPGARPKENEMNDPANDRPLAEHDLTACHRCGEPAIERADLLGRAVGVCAEHAGPREMRSIGDTRRSTASTIADRRKRRRTPWATT